MTRKVTWTMLVVVALMLLALWGYLASLDESEPIGEALSGNAPAPGAR